LKKKITLLTLLIIACWTIIALSEENFMPIEDVGLKVDSPVLVETELFGKVRLLGISEISQKNKYYRDAFNYVKDRVEEQRILVDVDGTAPTDELGHIRAVIYYRKDERWVNLNIEMVQLGYAKVIPVANSQIDPKAWFEYEKEARDKRLGVWEDFKPGELPKE
jgi:endonuclease YncB( thermonuclease family)